MKHDWLVDMLFRWGSYARVKFKSALGYGSSPMFKEYRSNYYESKVPLIGYTADDFSDLEEKIEQLEERQKASVVARFQLGFSETKIGKELGVSQKTAKIILESAINNIRSKYASDTTNG